MTVTGRADGPVVMLAHGFGCDQNMWRLVVPALAERVPGRAVRPRRRRRARTCRRGARSGTRPWTATPTTCWRSADELDLRDVVFVGHSVSAMIGVLAAAREPERFAGLGAAHPVAVLHRRRRTTAAGSARADIDELLESLESNYLGWSAAMAPVIMGNPDRPELGEELTNSFCRTDPDDRPGLRPHHVPVRQPRRPGQGDACRRWSLECANDAIAPPEVGAFVHAAIPGSRLVTLDATGHCPQLSAPEATAAAIAAFAGRLR